MGRPQAAPRHTLKSPNLRPDETIVDSEAYEAALASVWEDTANQKGFDWEMEKLRRYAAGLAVNENGGEDRA